MSSAAVAAFFSGLVPSLRSVDLRYNKFTVLDEAWFAGATDGNVCGGAQSCLGANTVALVGMTAKPLRLSLSIFIYEAPAQHRSEAKTRIPCCAQVVYDFANNPLACCANIFMEKYPAAFRYNRTLTHDKPSCSKDDVTLRNASCNCAVPGCTVWWL